MRTSWVEAMAHGIARRAVSRPRRTLALGVALALLGFACAARLEVRTSNLDLIDRDQPVVRNFRAFAETFGTPNTLILALEARTPAATPERLAEAVAWVVGRVEGLPSVRAVLAGPPLGDAALAAAGLDRWFASRDRRLFFVFVQPRDAESRVETIERFVAEVRAAVARPPWGSEIRFGTTGLPQYALDDRDTVRADLAGTSLWSFLAVTLVFATAFRPRRRPALAVALLLLPAGWVLGIASWLPGHLTLLSAFFAPILFGMGVDFSILVVDRLEEETLGGGTQREAVERTLRAVGPGILVGGISTATALLALVASGLRGFAELGWVAACSVLGGCLTALAMLPAALSLDGWRTGRAGAAPADRGRLARWVARLPSSRAALLVTACALGLPLLGRPGFDEDYLHLQPADSDTVRLERLLVDGTDHSTQFAGLVASSREEARAWVDRLLAEPAVGALRSGVELRPEVLGGPGAQAWQRSLLAPDGRVAVYAFPSGNAWDPGVRDEFAEAVLRVDPRATGLPILGRYMIQRSRRALWVASGLGIALNLLWLGWHFRDARRVALALLPTVIGVALLAGVMGAVGWDWNPISVMGLPLILGLGEDNAVHLLARLDEERGDVARALRGVGRGLVLTSGTTVVSFAALALARHPGLSALGAIVAAGVACTLLATLTVLPVAARVGLRWPATRALEKPVSGG